MLQATDNHRELVRWEYAAGEWEDFARFKAKTLLKEQSSYRNWFWGVLAATILVNLAIIFLFRRFMEMDWFEEGIWGPVFGISFLAGIPLAVIGSFWLVTRNRIDRFLALTGEVSIRLDGIMINRDWSGWVFEQNGWRFKGVSRKTVTTSTGAKVDVIEFKCTAYHAYNREDKSTVKIDHVPIPRGKDAEAEAVINALTTEAARFEEYRQV